MRGKTRWTSGGGKSSRSCWRLRDAQVFGQKRCQSKRRGDGLKEVVTFEEGQAEVAPSSKLEVYPSGVRRLKKEEKQPHLSLNLEQTTKWRLTIHIMFISLFICEISVVGIVGC